MYLLLLVVVLSIFKSRLL